MADIGKDLAERAYDILIRECGARESGRSDFVWGHTRGDEWDHSEWRFMGLLGFGGKFRTRMWVPPRPVDLWVTCYPEDRTPERDAMISNANVALKELAADMEKRSG